MSAPIRNVEPLGQGSQLVRPAQRHPLRHAHRAHPFVPGERRSHESRVVLQEPPVEVGVVRNDAGIADESGDPRQHPIYGVRVGHGLVRDARQLANALGDVPRRTNQLVQHPLVRDAVLRLATDDGDLDDRVALRTESGRLDVEDAERRPVAVGLVRLDWRSTTGRRRPRTVKSVDPSASTSCTPMVPMPATKPTAKSLRALSVSLSIAATLGKSRCPFPAASP